MKLMIVGIIFGILETWYFGWNRYPSCEAERICDAIVGVLIIVGYIQYVVRHELEKCPGREKIR